MSGSTRVLLKERLIESLIGNGEIDTIAVRSPVESKMKMKLKNAKVFKMSKNAFKRFIAHQSSRLKEETVSTMDVTERLSPEKETRSTLLIQHSMRTQESTLESDLRAKATGSSFSQK